MLTEGMADAIRKQQEVIDKLGVFNIQCGFKGKNIKILPHP